MWGANAHQINTFANFHYEKIAQNGLVVTNWTIMTLSWWVMSIAQPWDLIEWVSNTTDRFALDNETGQQRWVSYRPSNLQHTYTMDVAPWQTVSVADIWMFFDFMVSPVDGLQYLDQTTADPDVGQIRIEGIMEQWRVAIVRFAPAIRGAWWWTAPAAETAAQTPYDNTTSGLAWTDVQAAIDEVDATADALWVTTAANTAAITANDTDITALQARDPINTVTATPWGARFTKVWWAFWDILFDVVDATTPNPKMEIKVWWSLVQTIPLNLNDIQIDGTLSDFDLTDGKVTFVETNGDTSWVLDFSRYDISVVANPLGWSNIMQNGNLIVTVNDAGGIDYDNTTSWLAATNVQAAIDELAADSDDASLHFSKETGNAPLSPTAPADPVSPLVAWLAQREVYADKVLYWSYDGTNWTLEDTFILPVAGVPNQVITLTYPTTAGITDPCDPLLSEVQAAAISANWWAALGSADVVKYWPFVYVNAAASNSLVQVEKPCLNPDIKVTLSNTTLCKTDVTAEVMSELELDSLKVVLMGDPWLEDGDPGTITVPFTYVAGTSTYTATDVEYLTATDGFNSISSITDATGSVYAVTVAEVCGKIYTSAISSITTVNTLLAKLEDHDAVYNYDQTGVVDDIHGTNESFAIVGATQIIGGSNDVQNLQWNSYYTDWVDDRFEIPDAPAAWKLQANMSFWSWYKTTAVWNAWTISLHVWASTSSYSGLAIRLYGSGWGWFIYKGRNAGGFASTNLYGAVNFQDTAGNNPAALNDGLPHFIQWSIPGTWVADSVIYVDGEEYTAQAVTGNSAVAQAFPAPALTMMWHTDSSTTGWYSIRTDAERLQSYVITDHITLCEHRAMYNMWLWLAYS